MQVLLNRMQDKFNHRAEVYEATEREEAAKVRADHAAENARRAANKEKHRQARAKAREDAYKKRQGLI